MRAIETKLTVAGAAAVALCLAAAFGAAAAGTPGCGLGQDVVPDPDACVEGPLALEFRDARALRETRILTGGGVGQGVIEVEGARRAIGLESIPGHEDHPAVTGLSLVYSDGAASGQPTGDGAYVVEARPGTGCACAWCRTYSAYTGKCSIHDCDFICCYCFD